MISLPSTDAQAAGIDGELRRAHRDGLLNLRFSGSVFADETSAPRVAGRAAADYLTSILAGPGGAADVAAARSGGGGRSVLVGKDGRS